MKRFIWILALLLIPVHPVSANTTITIAEPPTRNAKGFL